MIMSTDGMQATTALVKLDLLGDSVKVRRDFTGLLQRLDGRLDDWLWLGLPSFHDGAVLGSWQGHTL